MLFKHRSESKSSSISIEITRVECSRNAKTRANSNARSTKTSANSNSDWPQCVDAQQKMGRPIHAFCLTRKQNNSLLHLVTYSQNRLHSVHLSSNSYDDPEDPSVYVWTVGGNTLNVPQRWPLRRAVLHAHLHRYGKQQQLHLNVGGTFLQCLQGGVKCLSDNTNGPVLRCPQVSSRYTITLD